VSGASGRRALDDALLEWMREPDASEDRERFEELALALFAHQFAHCVPYARFCRGRGATPETVARADDVPAVPTGAFKELFLASFPASQGVHVFRTSGTAEQRRGALHLDTLALYEASLLPTFERFVLPGLTGLVPMLILAPSAVEQPDSSLSHMFETVRRRRGHASSGFFLRGGKLAADDLQRALEAAGKAGQPVLVCGTAIAFVHLLDALAAADLRIALPAGSRLMETGGFKGRSREWQREELYAAISAALGVPPERIVNQYGMTELGSQFYDSVLARPDEERRKLGPPWARVSLRHPERGDPVGDGEVGIVHVHDLANTGSVAAIQTADLGRRCGDGFEVLGRAPGAEARGCSIAVDVMLGTGA